MKIIKQHLDTYKDEIEFAHDILSSYEDEFLILGTEEFISDILNNDDNDNEEKDYEIEPISKFPAEEGCKENDDKEYRFAIVESGYESYLDKYNVLEYAYILSNDEFDEELKGEELPEDIQNLIANLAKQFKENPCEHCIGEALIDFYEFSYHVGRMDEKLDKMIQIQKELEEYGLDFSDDKK